MTNPNDQAFAGKMWEWEGIPREVNAPGLTKREWFAGMAMRRFIGLSVGEAAEGAVEFADALIAELNKG